MAFSITKSKKENWRHYVANLVSSLGWNGVILTVTGDLTVTGVFLPSTATSTALNAIGNAINTDASKVQGVMVYNTTTDNPVYAVGNTDGAVWVDGAGTTVNTPVA